MYFIKEEIPDFSSFLGYFKFGIPFTQTFAYYQWNKSYGTQVKFFTIYSNSNQIGFFSIFHYKIYNNFNIGYIPYGPVLKEHSFDLILHIKKFLHMYGKNNGLFAIRLDFTTQNYEKISYLHEIYDEVPRYSISNFIQPRTEWYINLSEEIEQIYQKMHKNTRYSIKKSYERGTSIDIIEKNYTKYINTFESIMLETSIRNNFTPHSKLYYTNVFDTLEKLKNKPDFNSWLTIARFKNEILAMSLFVAYDDVIHYLYSCSLNKHRDKYPVYAAIWETIKKAKQLKYKYLNLGNVDNINEQKFHSLTMFKQRFGGNFVQHPNLCEIKVKKIQYFLYLAYKKFFK